MLCCFESKARPDRTDDQTAEVVVLERHVQMAPVPIVRSAQKFRDSNPRFRTTLPTKSGVVPEHNTKLLRSEEHTSELQSRRDLVCRLLLEKKKSRSSRERSRPPG